jgi:hypothetical protein
MVGLHGSLLTFVAYRPFIVYTLGHNGKAGRVLATLVVADDLPS